MAMPFIGCSQLQWFNSYPSGSAINTPLVVLNSVTSGDPFCSASLNGTVTSDGGSAITERGFCYNTTGNPTTANNKIVVSGTVGNYTSSTSALTSLSLYYFRAYAVNAAGTGYSADISISTINQQSLSATDVDVCNNNARDIAVVITENGNTITDRRIRYGSSSTNENNVSVGAGGSTTIHLTSLTANTYYIYYVDTYAGSCRVSTYEQNFTTSNYTAPTTTTDLYNNVTNTTAGLYGTTTFDGNATITQKGFVYGLSANPTLADNVKYSTINSSYFNETVEGLTAGTTYHFRAFSTNCVSTAYGTDMSFTTTGGCDYSPTVLRTRILSLTDQYGTFYSGTDLSSATSMHNVLCTPPYESSATTSIEYLNSYTIGGKLLVHSGNYYCQSTLSGYLILYVDSQHASDLVQFTNGIIQSITPCP